jgi:hypothetical protein
MYVVIIMEPKISDYTAFKRMDLPTLDRTVVMHSLMSLIHHYFMALATCGGDNCTAECREGLINFKAAIGCCYQNVYNNTPYFVQLLNAGIITPSFFTQFVRFNDPISNPWKACSVKPPQPCPTHPFSAGELAAVVMFLILLLTGY